MTAFDEKYYNDIRINTIYIISNDQIQPSQPRISIEQHTDTILLLSFCDVETTTDSR